MWLSAVFTNFLASGKEMLFITFRYLISFFFSKLDNFWRKLNDYPDNLYNFSGWMQEESS